VYLKFLEVDIEHKV